MFLTTLHVNRHNRSAVVELRDLCRMHARVTDMTVGMPEGPRVLWAQPLPSTLVVRATQPITLNRLPDGWAKDATHREWAPPGYGRHRAVMVVNPTRQRTETRADGSRHNVRWPLHDREEQVAWLHELLQPFINRLDVQITDERVRKGWHRDRRRVVHRLITVQLRGEVTNPGELAAIVTKGFGRARAYGGGLTIWEKL